MDTEHTAKEILQVRRTPFAVISLRMNYGKYVAPVKGLGLLSQVTKGDFSSDIPD